MAKRILIVDDEPDLLEVISIRLKKSGFEIIQGKDGKEALDLTRQMLPDLIIIDVYLPYINGDEVVRIIKADEALKHIPIILISATLKSISEKFQNCGANTYKTKPFESEDLINTIKQLIG